MSNKPPNNCNAWPRKSQARNLWRNRSEIILASPEVKRKVGEAFREMNAGDTGPCRGERKILEGSNKYACSSRNSSNKDFLPQIFIFPPAGLRSVFTFSSIMQAEVCTGPVAGSYPTAGSAGPSSTLDNTSREKVQSG